VTSCRVVIADDEPLARERLRTMLASHDGYNLVGEAGDGAAAVDLILRLRPNLVFLDIRMPEFDGFEVIEAVEANASGFAPEIVFVTAHAEYAVKAFEVRALDYLLKPFDRRRFDRALASAATRRARRSETGNAGLDSGLRDLLATVRSAGSYPPRFLIKGPRRIYFVRASDIDWVDAAGNYVRLHAGGKIHMIRQPLGEFQEKVNPAMFVRIHRSAIVNIDRVEQFERHLHGEYVVTMRDGARLVSSRAHGARLRALLR
jgi:two-component system, LytTR family, response regulator